MSADTWAAQQFTSAVTDPGFAARVRAAGADEPAAVKVFDEQTSIGEVLARVGHGAVVAIASEAEPHGFAVGFLRWNAG